MWVFSDAGTTAAGDTLYSFTHRTFLEYFAAWHLSATSDTPEDLADRLITLVNSSNWEVVGELAIQIKDRSTDQGADRAYQRILARTENADDRVRRLFIMLLTLWMPGTSVSPIVARRVTDAVLAQLLPPSLISVLPFALQKCGARYQSIIADELGSVIATLVGSDQDSIKLAGLQIALSLAMSTMHAGDFWANWCEELTALYATAVEAFSALSPALRTLALYTSVISIDQALAMPGGFSTISQRYPIIGFIPVVPYPLYMAPSLGGKTPDPASIAVCTAVGKYLVDHPDLPWASGSPDHFNHITNRIDELTSAKLDEFSSLGAGAAYAVNAEFRGLERKSIGLVIERFPLPAQFRQLFRDWANGNVNLIELRDQ